MYFMHRPAISIDVGNGQQRSKMMNSLILEDWTRRRIGEQEVTGLATQPTRIQPDLSTWLAPTGRPSPPAYPTLPWRRNLLSRWVWGSKRSATPRCLLLAFIASCTLTVVYSQLLDCNNDAAVWSTAGSEVYSWTASFPQGCTCLQTDVAATDCKYFDCECICDLTAGACDANCCCDTECSDEAIARFESLDACLEEGPMESTTVLCYDSNSLEKINPSFPMKSVDTVTAAVDGLLCIEYDNSPSKGAFIADPGSLGSSAFTSSVVALAHSYSTDLDTSGAVASPQDGATYDMGDRIPVGFSNERVNDGLVAAYGGFMPLPSAGADGSCSDAVSPMLFEQPVIDQECVRVALSPENDCEGAFSAARLSSLLFMGTSANVVPDSTPGDDEFVAITVASVKWRNWDTGVEVDFTAAYNCDAYWFDGTSPAPAATGICNMGGALGTTALQDSLTADPLSVSAGCRNALVSACFTITHDGAGSIVSASADLVVADVPAPTESGASLVAMQSYTTQFTTEEPPTTSTDQGNQVKRIRSGNPGYLVGAPLLFGARTEDGEGDQMIVPQQGLTLSGAGLQCNSTQVTRVDFGYDVLTCCGLELTRSQLEELCNGDGVYISSDGFTPNALSHFNVSNTYLGALGNADPSDVNQWIAVNVAAGTATQSWADASGTCSNMVSSLNWRVMYARIGAEANLQAKIVAADTSYGKTDWIWIQGGEQEDTQTFGVCSTVTFFEHESSKAIYTPPPPPIGLKLPYDLFYPFHIEGNAAAARYSSFSWMWAPSIFAFVAGML